MKKNSISISWLFLGLFFALIEMEYPKTSMAAEDYPSKPIEFVVGFSPGGGTDILARIVADKINKYLEGRGKMYITNKPGSSGVVGLNYAIKSKPDGYTIGSVHGSNTYIAFLFPENTPYTMDSFETICNITRSLYVLCVRTESPFKTFEQLIEYSKNHPGSLTCSSVGKTSTPNVYFELLKLKEKVEIPAVHFTGAGPAANAILGGHVDMTVTNDTSIAPHIKSGNIRVLLQFDESRRYPNVPTSKDRGITIPLAPNGCGVPVGVPRDRFKKLCDLFERAMQDAEVIEKLKSVGEIPDYLNSQQYKEFLVKGYKTVELIKDKLK
jgi:tripartite-type tricarboxylate transporter receptor subunit TctC